MTRLSSGYPARTPSEWERIASCASPLRISALLLLALILPLTACHSYHIDATVENRTGVALKLLEVDYPSASFGADTLASGADFHYRFQIRGSGQLTVQYTTPDEKQIQIKGPSLAERQQGQLEIVLLPSGKAEFHPQLTAQP